MATYYTTGTSFNNNLTAPAYYYSDITWTGSTITTSLHTTEGKKELNQQVRTVLLKAGHVGQVVALTHTGDNVVLWESKPKKTAAKALKAAYAAQLEAARYSFGWVEA